jgi:transcriptional regulator with XRE-family HTH domain
MFEKEKLCKELGERIREIRKNKNLTLQNLAAKSKISTAYLSEVERGLSNISGEKLYRIANILGVALQDLISPSTIIETKENTITIPIALSEAAVELRLKYSTMKRLFQGANSLVARKLTVQGQEWTKQNWIEFYKKVQSIIEEQE